MDGTLLQLAVAGVRAIARGMRHVAHAIFGPPGQARRRLAAGSSQLIDGNLATLTGTVEALGAPLVAPLSGHPCVLHYTRGRIYEAPRRVDTPVAEPSELRTQPFALATSDGRVIVEATSVELLLPFTTPIPRSLERELEFLRRHGHAFAMHRDCSFDEIAISPGDRISVHGLVVREVAPAEEGGYRDVAPRTKLVDSHGPITIGPARRR